MENNNFDKATINNSTEVSAKINSESVEDLLSRVIQEMNSILDKKFATIDEKFTAMDKKMNKIMLKQKSMEYDLQNISLANRQLSVPGNVPTYVAVGRSPGQKVNSFYML